MSGWDSGLEGVGCRSSKVEGAMVSSRVRDQGVGFPSRMNLASKGLGFGVYQVVPTCLTGCGRFLSLPAKWCFIFRTDGKKHHNIRTEASFHAWAMKEALIGESSRDSRIVASGCDGLDVLV